MIKEIHVMINNVNEYIIKIERGEPHQTTYRLFTTPAECWDTNYRNVELLSVFDDGDGIKISEINNQLDYSEMHYLYLLLECILKMDPNYESHKYYVELL